MTMNLFPAAPKIRGDAAELQLHERLRYRADWTRRTMPAGSNPGPLGELAYRELTMYAEFGYRFSDDGLILRLAAAVLATWSDHRPEAEQEP